MDDELRQFLNHFATLARLAREMSEHDGTPLHRIVRTHLDGPPGDLPVVTVDIPPHRWADFDLAVADLAEHDPDGRLVGVRGGPTRYHLGFADMVAENSPWGAMSAVGPVDYLSVPVGPEAERATVSFGVRLFRFDGVPVAVAQRAANPQVGAEQGRVEIMTPQPETARALVAALQERALELSVLRGQVIGFAADRYGSSGAGVTFHERPRIDADQVVLPPGTLPRIASHVLGIAQHREQLTAAGQHLKRGVLLYGPPGTGKTHTVRYLIGASPGTTVVLLSGETFGSVRDAAVIARAHEPALVVLEDCDLIAPQRGFGEQHPLLFELLDVMDGLDADADVTFLLTTNRADLLEEALSQRPGRVDLAVEIPLPGRDERLRLLHVYAAGLGLSPQTLEAVAGRTDGTTASFAKELVRRTVLAAAEQGRAPFDDDLLTTLDELLAQGDTLTRSLLGVRPPQQER